jgi:hypothetical protein
MIKKLTADVSFFVLVKAYIQSNFVKTFFRSMLLIKDVQLVSIARKPTNGFLKDKNHI